MQEPVDSAVIRYLQQALAESLSDRRRNALELVIASAVSGIPWVGQIATAGVALKGEAAALHRDALLRVWIEALSERYKWLQADLTEAIDRIATNQQATDERLESEEYLQVVRRSFSAWDRADSQAKRRYAANIVVNAAATRVVEDDVVRLFIDLLDNLHEIHLRVIHELFDHPRLTRLDMWKRIYGAAIPAENSAEADLYRKVISDLSLGRIARQHRETTLGGAFIAQEPGPRRPRPPGPRVVGTSFDKDHDYELTSLGRQFVHYVMTDAVGAIEAPQ